MESLNETKFKQKHLKTCITIKTVLYNQRKITDNNV